jgi:uncharacterized repeat protein (TIGR03803 family)
LIADASGNLYGTTVTGGANNGGTVFKLTGSTYQNLYAFCAQANCSDGQQPTDSTTIDAQGNLIGVTVYGGSFGAGTIFKIDTGGAYTKLYDFCSQTDCADGQNPTGNPVIDAQGNLFGTTTARGSHNAGVLYKFDGTLHVLYDFCAIQGCSDGRSPGAPLIMDGAGNLYGTTSVAQGFGNVFEFAP